MLHHAATTDIAASHAVVLGALCLNTSVKDATASYVHQAVVSAIVLASNSSAHNSPVHNQHVLNCKRYLAQQAAAHYCTAQW
jgi:hypothetical protein